MQLQSSILFATYLEGVVLGAGGAKRRVEGALGVDTGEKLGPAGKVGSCGRVNKFVHHLF